MPEDALARVLPDRAMPTVFVDRDGVINADVGYLTDLSLLTLLPGAAEAIRALNEHGFPVVVATNQSAIGRGLMGSDQLDRIHAALRDELARAGATIDAIVYCPHTPEDGCSCRKPAPGLLHRAGVDRRIDLGRSYLVGDKASDLLAGRSAGCRRCILVTSYRTSPDATGLSDFTCASLAEAVSYILIDALSNSGTEGQADGSSDQSKRGHHVDAHR